MKTVSIQFEPMRKQDIPLWLEWSNKPHVKDVWFIEGYETRDYINAKIVGNGYDYPFIICVDDKPIGYIVCCDLFAYRTLCPTPKGLFTQEQPGTFCFDLFIGEEDFLNKGYGTQIIKLFIRKVFDEFSAKMILIDPAVTNKRSIHIHEKIGFQFIKIANDGVTDCYVMKMTR